MKQVRIGTTHNALHITVLMFLILAFCVLVIFSNQSWVERVVKPAVK